MSNDAHETIHPSAAGTITTDVRHLEGGSVKFMTLRRSSGIRRRMQAIFEASDATVIELRPDGSVAYLHTGCASAARCLGVAGQPMHSEVTWEVANDNAVPASLHDVITNAAQGQGAMRSSLTLAGAEHDVCVVPQRKGGAICVLRPSRFSPGVAHDLNGCLAVTVASAEMLLREPGLSSEGQSALRDVLEAARRAESLTGQLMTAATLGGRGGQVIDLGSELVSLVPLLRRPLRQGVQLVWDVRGDAPCVRIDPVHLQRIVMNLVANAAQAIDGVGTITVRAYGEASDASGGETDTAVLEVVDTGRGMSPEALERLGRERYSSRASGHGLGMANVRDLVRLAGGALELDSVVGKGTCVTVTLPAFLTRSSGVLGYAPFVTANEQS